MFQLFAQGERHISRSEGGLGIGLTLVQKLAEHARRGVNAHSDGPGKGSEFVVHLPAARPPAQLPAADGQPRRKANAGLRVLVVDDNRDAASLMATLLEAIGSRNPTVHDGRNGRRLGRCLPSRRRPARHRPARHGRLRGLLGTPPADETPASELSPSRATAKNKRSGGRERPGLTTTWSSPSTSKSSWRSSRDQPSNSR